MPGEQQERLPQLQVQLEPQQLVAALQVQPGHAQAAAWLKAAMEAK